MLEELIEKLKTKGLGESSIKLYTRNLIKLNDGLAIKFFKFLLFIIIVELKKIFIIFIIEDM